MSLKTSDLKIIRTIPASAKEFLSGLGSDPTSVTKMHRLYDFPRFCKAVREARKNNTALPYYLNPLTEKEKEIVVGAYMTWQDPEKLLKFMTEVEDAELQYIRLLILKDRIENKGTENLD